MLIGQPFPLGGICVASADVLGLQVLHLGEDVVTVAHGNWLVVN